MTQDEALEILKTGVNVFLTGEPGSGKTHTVNRFVRYLRANGIGPAVTASTGIAATHIGGFTVHSWSGIGIRRSFTAKDLDDIKRRKQVVRRIAKAGSLIIDEISMLDGAALSMVDAVCRAVRASAKPFGGLQTIFVGDFFQLPPVARALDAPPQFAFQSPAWLEATPAVCYLSEQHRQEDSAYLDILTALRSAAVEARHIELLRTRRTDAGQAEAVLKLFSHNADADRINTAELARLPGEAHVFRMASQGPEALVEQIKRGCLSPEVLVLKAGAKVMFTKNSPDSSFVNGTTGEVTHFQEEGWPVVRTRDGRRITAQPMDWGIDVENETITKISQAPLRLAWAITVHKSQGMSLDAAFMDLSRAFEYGQGYVALSRVRTLAGLHLAGWNERALETHPAIRAHDGRFRTQSNRARERLRSIGSEELASRHENFIRRCGGAAADGKGKDKGGPEDAGQIRAARPARAGAGASTRDQTLRLIKEGKTVAEAACIRGLAEGTILKHLEELRGLGKFPAGDIAHLASGQEKAFTEIHAALRAAGAEKLKPVHDRLAGRHSYENIRLARLLLPEE